MLTEKDFIYELKKCVDEAPNVSLQEQKSCIYKQVEAFRKFTKTCIEAGKFKTVGKCFLYAERLLDEGNFLIKNAICNAYIYGLGLDNGHKNHQKAKSKLPTKLAQVWTDFAQVNYP